MKELIYNVFSLSAIFALAGTLITDKRLEGALRLCFSVIFSSVIFLSVASLLSGGVETPEYSAPELSEPAFGFDEILAKATREGLMRSLCREFSLSEEEITIVLDEAKSGEYLSQGVSVTLRGKAALADYRAIENYLYEGGYESVRIKLSLDS